MDGSSKYEFFLEQDKELENLLNLVPDLVFRVDKDLRHLFVNQRVSDVTGLSRDRYLGRTNRELKMSEELCDLWDKTFLAVFRDKKPLEIEFPFPSTKGLRYYQMRIIPEKAPDGAVLTAIGFARDQTEQKQIEDVLRESKERLRAALDVTGGAIYEHHVPLDDTTYHDDRWAQMLGYQPDELPAYDRFLDWLFGQVHPEDHDRLKRAYRDFVEGKVPGYHVEVRLRHKKGHWIWVQGYSNAVERDESGRVLRIVGLMLDITEHKRAEEALQKSRQDLNRAQAVSHVGSWRLDVQRDELTWSDESYRICGVPKGTALTYETFLAIVHPDDREYVDRKWKAALKGAPYDIEHRFVIGGKVKWARERAELEFDEKGTLLGGFGTCQDITELKQAEEMLSAERNFSNAVLDTAGALVIVLDRKGRIVRFNKSCEKKTGYTSAEAIGKVIWDFLLTENEKPGVRDVFKRLEAGLFPSEFENHWITRSGELILISWSITAILSHDGAVEYIIGTGEDITERKKAEEELNFAVKMSQALNRINDVLHLTLDLDEVARKVVVEGANALGSDTGSLSLRKEDGWTVWHVYKMPRNLIGARMDDVQEQHAVQAIKSGAPVVVEDAFNDDRFNREHVRRYDVRAVLVAPMIIQKQPFGVIFFNYHKGPHKFSETEINFARQLAATASIALENARLFADLRETEKELRTSRNELQDRVKERTAQLQMRADQLARLTSELTLAEQRERRRIAKILHDHLQQLMVAAKMGQEMLILKADNALKPAAENVIDLINQSIKASRTLTAELSPPVLRSGDLSAALEWLSQWLRENQGFEVNVQTEPGIVLEQKNLTVLLFQSIRELLLNVVKHAGVRSARVEMFCDETKRLRISVIDQGAGFDPDTIWEKAKAGTGFGLLNIRERITLLGGNLEIQSSPGNGACFSLVIPVEIEKSHRRIEKNMAEHQEVKTSEEKIRVLIADDHTVIRQAISTMLNLQSDIEVIGEASDGEAATHMVRDLMPDVILMDINMPHMNGIEATRIIHSEFPHIRIIGLSMFDSDEGAKMIEAGATVYRSKTGNSDLLLSAVRGEVK